MNLRFSIIFRNKIFKNLPTAVRHNYCPTPPPTSQNKTLGKCRQKCERSSSQLLPFSALNFFFLCSILIRGGAGSGAIIVTNNGRQIFKNFVSKNGGKLGVHVSSELKFCHFLEGMRRSGALKKPEPELFVDRSTNVFLR